MATLRAGLAAAPIAITRASYDRLLEQVPPADTVVYSEGNVGGVPAFVADYRLAPEHAFPAALDDARTAYRGLTTQLGTQHVALVGDSAGGGLALSLLREEPDARCGVLLSPWTDLALTGGSLERGPARPGPALSRPTWLQGAAWRAAA